ncbi:MAG TPA: hypothetical protein VKR23_13395 [Gaiellaceae bacterium]|nr:hypothetical protein [Gaiellaceae bacterium]
MHRLPRVSPALVISLVALFFALGGTAFAVGSKELSAQPRCAAGAIRGLAVVTGQSVQGVGNLTSQWSSATGLFGAKWNCGGGQIMVRKSAGTPGVDIKFVGNPSTVAIVSSADTSPSSGSVSRSSDGSFHVSMGGSNQGVAGPWQFQNNIPFTIVLL